MVFRYRFGRACELEEDRTLGTFDNSAQQAIALFRRAFGSRGSSHSGVGAGNVYSGDLKAVDGPFFDFGHVFGWIPIGLLELAYPPIDIRFHATALAWAEIVDAALAALLVPGRGWNLISSQTHGPRTLRLPPGRNRPFEIGGGLRREEDRSEKNQSSRYCSHKNQYAILRLV